MESVELVAMVEAILSVIERPKEANTRKRFLYKPKTQIVGLGNYAKNSDFRRGKKRSVFG